MGSDVSKDYIDNSIPAANTFASEVGFHYFSVYGEYHLISSRRLLLSVNTQVGAGRVDDNFPELNLERDRVREIKSLVEHSIKADVLTLPWLRTIGGIGYRYLPSGEDQIKDAFNSPIYIVGFSIDYKRLFGKG